nr:hypothetical transcript [Hymenolepis microstoma]
MYIRPQFHGGAIFTSPFWERDSCDETILNCLLIRREEKLFVHECEPGSSRGGTGIGTKRFEASSGKGCSGWKDGGGGLLDGWIVERDSCVPTMGASLVGGPRYAGFYL